MRVYEHSVTFGDSWKHTPPIPWAQGVRGSNPRAPTDSLFRTFPACNNHAQASEGADRRFPLLQDFLRLANGFSQVVQEHRCASSVGGAVIAGENQSHHGADRRFAFDGNDLVGDCAHG
jgi:hypothetical protein